MKTLTFFALFGLMSTQVFSKDIFLMTKSIREKNIIHYDIKVKDCRLMNKSLTAFWILGEKQGQVQQLKPDEVTQFAPKIVSEHGDGLEFTLPAFEELQSEITENPIRVKLVGCQPKAFVKIDGESIELQEIYAKISILKRGVKYLLIKGKRADGSKFSYKINV